MGSQMQSIYKRYYALPGPIERDVRVEFVQNFNRGLNLLGKDNAAAFGALDLALKYCPEPKYPYIYYYMSEAQRKMGKIEPSYKLLKYAAAMDSVLYEVDKDLYLYEYRFGNLDSASYYRSRVAKIVPWYMPRLDSLVTTGQ